MEKRPYIYDESANLTTLRDPMILLDGDTYYMTGTQEPYWKGANDGVHLWSSRDLENWVDHGNMIKRSDLPADFWGIDRFWAPELFKTKGGKYVLTFNALNESEEFRHVRGTGIAVADNPTGPYTILTKDGPVNREFGSCNDGSVFADDDGRVYLSFNGRKVLYVSELDLENCRLGRTDVVCRAGAEGEWDSIGIEGPCIVKRHGIYFYWYSSWTNGYAAGVLTADNIHGPWTKCAENPIVSESEIYYKAGHNNCFRGKDGKDYISFHANMRDPSDGDRERIFIRPVEYTEDGKVIVK